MKKRIISLILVAVMALLALSSCAYSYEKDDMSKYATFDSEAFFKALTDGKITIADGTFGTDEEGRWEKVADDIFTTLGKNADTDEKVKEGKAGKYDKLYYCYYATVEIDGKEHIFFASKMAASSATNFQMGISTVEGLNEKIEELVKSKEDIKDFIYTIHTSDVTSTADKKESVAAAGDVIYVSYTKKYTAFAYDKDGNVVMDGDKKATETKTETVAYEKVTLNGAEGSFLANLVGKKVNETNKFDVTDNTLETDDKTVHYTNVKINWIVENDTEIGTVTDKTYTSTKKEKDVYGTEIDLKDKELTYHIFPVYLIDVEDELTAELVLKHFYSNVAATETDDDDKTVYKFDCVENGGFKKDDKELKALVTELTSLNSDLSAAKSDLTNAEKDKDETKIKNAKAAVEKAEKAIDDKIAEILAATNDKNEDVKAALVKDMKQYKYDTLETSYKNTIKSNLAKEVFELAKKYITYKTEGANNVPVLPKRAVMKAYDRIENTHKVDFYEGNYTTSSSSGSTSSTTESNYRHYNGDFNEFLKVEYFGKDASKYTMQNVYDKIGAAAEESVREIILVHVLADAYKSGTVDLAVTDEDVDDFKNTYLYYLYNTYYGTLEEGDYMPALLLNNVMNHILEEVADEDYVEDTENDNNKVQYIRVKYTIDEDADETEDEDDDHDHDHDHDH